VTAYDGPAVAGVYDARAPLGEDDGRALMTRLLGESNVTVMRLGPLAVACRGGESASVGDMSAVLIGRPWNLLSGGGALELAERSRDARADELLRPLRGSFATVLWDAERGRGIVAGDAVGGYAVYYTLAGERVIFASEQALLARLLPRRPEPDPLAVVNALGGGGIQGMTTMLRGVHRVPEGSLLRLEAGRAREAVYWAPTFAPAARTSHAALVSSLWQQVENAVDARLEHGGHTAIVMSGGVDSSAVAAAASRRVQDGDALTGYAAVFPDYADVDESQRITELTRALGVQAMQVSVRPAGIMRLALEFLARWETGFPGPGYVLEHELLRRAAADGATAALDGQGGDEVFALWPFVPTDLLLRGRLVASWQAIQQFPGGSGRSWRRIGRAWRNVALRGAVPHAVELAARRRSDPSAHTPAWLKAEHALTYMAASDGWAWKQRRGSRSWAYQSDMLAGPGRAGFAEYLRRRAQPHGIEARPPLIDLDLLDFALAMPPEASFDPFLDRPLIREAMLHLVPDSVRLERSKSNLAPFYLDGITADLPALRRLLGDADARILAYAEREPVLRMLDAAADRDSPDWLQRLTSLWNLAGFEAWLRHEEDPASTVQMLDTWDLSEPAAEALETAR
jgi:asparagine synthase (glutamine-hydrolysing)